MLAPILTALLASLSALHGQTVPGMEHQHSHAPLPGEKLGHVDFPTSCSQKSQPAIERGVALLHSFGYTEAQLQFEAITNDDPTCAMAHWGLAMSQFNVNSGPPDKHALALGGEQMATVRDLAASSTLTPREQGYIAALDAFFSPKAAGYGERISNYEAKMNDLHARFPDDVEIAAFDALAILTTTPPDDTSLTHQHRALAILQPLFAANPQHPGLAHYIIHTCDTPSLAQEGLAAARVYAKIAPSSPHALHMPGHIFARLGMWDEDIASNLASVAASKHFMETQQPGAAHQMHAQEFLIYAYLQKGEDEKARDLTAQIRTIGEEMRTMPQMDDMKEAGHYFDNELRTILALEMHDWKRMAALLPAPGSDGRSSLIDWGHAIAAGHLHDRKRAAAAVAQFDARVAERRKEPDFARVEAGFAIFRNELVAWELFTDGKAQSAVDTLRKVADYQDKVGQNEVDIPVRELLGDMLMLENKPAEALAEYKTSLKLSPNRLNTFLSAGRAAELSGNREEAISYYRLASTQTNAAAQSRRPELLRAVRLAAQPRRSSSYGSGSTALAGQ